VRFHATIDAIRSLKYKYGQLINFCTIVPASLPNYFTYFNPDSTPPGYLVNEQAALEVDINVINNHISLLNCHITNINLSSRFQAKSKKKRQRSGNKTVYRRVSKFKYSSLVDGVHFSQSMKRTCFSLIIGTTIRDSIASINSIEEAGTSKSNSGAHRLQSWPVSTVKSARNKDKDHKAETSGEESSSHDDWGDFRRFPKKRSQQQRSVSCRP
jgi:hypothetical protein